MAYKYRKYDGKDNYLPINGSPQTFLKEYKACYFDKKRDKTNLFWIVNPWFEFWINLFNNPKKKPCLQYGMLIGKIDYETNKGESDFHISNYLKRANTKEDLKSELQWLFLKHLKQNLFTKKWPRDIMPPTLQYLTNREYIRLLARRIIKISRRTLIEIEFNIQYHDFKVEDTHIDYLAHKNITSDNFDRYLLYLNYMQMTRSEKLAHTRIHESALSLKEKELCTKLKKHYETIPQSVISKV